MSGAVIVILFCSVLNFIFLLKSKKRLCANIYETEIWTTSYLKKFDFVGFFHEAKNDKIRKATPSSILFKGLDNPALNALL